MPPELLSSPTRAGTQRIGTPTDNPYLNREKLEIADVVSVYYTESVMR